MRAGSPNLEAVLTGSFDVTWSCDVFVEGVRVLAQIPITNVRLTEDATALVQGTGSFTVIYQDTFGQTITPYGINDVFAPFGTQLVLYATVFASAGFSETVQMGTYLVSETPSILAQWGVFNGAILSKGDRIDVSFQDLMSRTQKNTFDTPSSPASLASVWAEVQSLTQLPVTRTVADGPIPNTVAYRSNRLQAAYDLAEVLDATLCMTADGTVAMRPNVWPAVIDQINGGDGGTLIGAPRALQNTDVYNRLVVQDSAGNTLGSAQIKTGRLRAQNPDGSLSPYGMVTAYYSSPQITTKAAGQQYADANIQRYAGLRGMQVQVTEVFNPMRDLGDVVTVNRRASGVIVESFVGRVTQISRAGRSPQSVTLAVNA